MNINFFKKNKSYKNNKFKVILLTFVLIFFLILNKCINFNFLKNNFLYKNYFSLYKYCFNIKNNLKNYKKIIKNKNDLILENNKLKFKLNLKKSIILILKKYKKENKKFRKILKIKNIKEKIITSNIIKKNYIKNILTIDKGYKDNIKIGQVAINKNGIIGQVVSVDHNFSEILSVCSRLNYIPSKIKRNNFKCILRGCGYKNELYIYDNLELIKNNDIKINDIFISSGEDIKFPPNIPIAKVIKINIKNNRVNNLIINPIFNIKKIDYLFIIEKLNN